MKLSIVIPMYNVEQYVERCIHSLENQDVPREEYEIICVNDGSPDRSGRIVHSLQDKYNNILLIDQENQGVSRARNNGIDRATGDYVLFVDPDDFVDRNSFSRILDNASANNAEVSFLGFTFLNSDGSIRQQVFNETLRTGVFNGIEAYKLSRGDGRTDPDRMWAVLFRRDFMNKHGLRFLPDVPYLEDGELIARVMCLAERCAFDGYSFYQRTTRPGSATNSKLFHSERSTRGFLRSVRNLVEFSHNVQLKKEQQIFLNQPILKFALLSIHSSLGIKRIDKLWRTIGELKSLNLRRISLQGCNSTFRVYGHAYNVSPYLAVIVLWIYPRIRHWTHKIKSS